MSAGRLRRICLCARITGVLSGHLRGGGKVRVSDSSRGRAAADASCAKEDGGEDGGNDGDGATNGVVVRRGGRRQTPDEGAVAGRRALTGYVRVYSTL